MRITLKDTSESVKLYMPVKVSEEAQICLSCDLEKCNTTNCQRFRNFKKAIIANKSNERAI